MLVGILGLILSLLYTFMWSTQGAGRPRATRHDRTTSAHAPLLAAARGANLSSVTRELGGTGLRGRLGLPPTVEPDPGNSGAGSRRDDPPQEAALRAMGAAPSRTRYDVVVVGAGVIGLACAWRIAERGLSVCVLERDDAGRGRVGRRRGDARAGHRGRVRRARRCSP